MGFGGSPGGGSATSNIFDIFADGEVPYAGIRASYRGADSGWSARGIQSVPGVQASVFLPISGTPGAGWRFTFEQELAVGATGNIWRLLRFPRSPIIPAVAASVQWEYTSGRFITITDVAAGAAGNADAINAHQVASLVQYVRSDDGGARYDIRYTPTQTVANIVVGANAAFSDIVLSPGTGYQSTDIPTLQLGPAYVRFSGGADEVPAQTILATVHSAPSTAFTLRIAATDTLAAIRSAIISYLTSEGIALSTVGVLDEATDTFDVPAVDPGLDFAGGVNGVPLGASVDEASKIIDVAYDAGTNTLAELLAEMVTAGIKPEYRGSVDGTESPEAVGWIRTFGPITAAGTTTSAGTAPALTSAQIKQKYEANVNTNAFTNAEQTKLGGIETGATEDQTGSEIKTAYESESDTNAFTNAQKTKLDATLSTSDLLDKIKEGSGIAIDRLTTPGEITVSSIGGVDLPVVYLGRPTTVADGALTFAKPTGYPTTGRYPVGTLLSFISGYFTPFENSNTNLRVIIGTDSYTFEDVNTGSLYYRDLVTDTAHLLVATGSGTLQLLAPPKPPTGSEIKAAYEGELDTNAFTDTLKSKLDGAEADATGDQTGSEIKTAYEAEANTNAFTNVLKSKLDAAENNATADQTGADIVALLDALTGNSRLQGAAVRAIADAIDSELGSTAWRTGGSSTSGGLNQGQVDARVTARALLKANNLSGLADAASARTNLGINLALFAALTGASFTGAVVGIAPSAAAHLTRKDYVDDADGLKASLSGATFTGPVKGPTPIANVDLSTKKYVDDADVLGALISGTTFTGATGGISPVGSSDFVTKEYADANYSGGSTPVQSHDLWAGWSTDSTVTETEVLAGVSSDTATITLPTGSGNQFLWVWRSNLDGGDPSEVYIAGGLNQRNTFVAAVALAVSGVAGQLIVSVTSQNVGLLGGENVRVA